jgi:acetyl-CoA carboxylase biotin carboxyl carrier protein
MMEIRADIDASVWQVHVEVGQEVTQGEELIVLESMKMEIPVEASIAGAVASLSVAPGDTVKRGDILLVLEERPKTS